MNFSYFLRSICISVYILKPCQEIGQSFEESLQGKHVKNLEMFWMNNRTIIIIKFGMMLS